MLGKWQLKDHEAERRLFDGRLLTAVILIVLLFAALVLKLINLQITQFEYFSARSDGNRLHSQYVPPARGLIFDRNGEMFAQADHMPVHLGSMAYAMHVYGICVACTHTYMYTLRYSQAYTRRTQTHV
mgnify:CR=1 FL=1